MQTVPVLVQGDGRGRWSSGFPLLPILASDTLAIFRRHVLVLVKRQVRVVAVVAATVVDIAALLIARRRFQILVNPAQTHRRWLLLGAA